MSEPTETNPLPTEETNKNEFDDPDYEDARAPPPVEPSEEVAETEAPAVEKSMEKSLQLKEDGNEKFKQQLYEEAIETYEEALMYCPDEEAKHKAVLYSNIAVCLQKLDENDEVVEYCTRALEQDKDFVKPLINRGHAYYQLKKFEESLEDYKRAKTLKPDLGYDVERRITELTKKVDEMNEQKKEEVMKNLKDLGNTLLGKFGMSLDNFKLNKNDNGSYNCLLYTSPSPRDQA
eukprot:TRINITY_DN1928_c0_g1_i6.p2 TRINITY_DN1928_c0_g1~~TRINITY_DN1928_c0_g1_i6.p2  ORF type:complete len:234 (-),score=67.11 TRINITY_DN1928_c0_g1_i6:103-804(-)